MAGKNKKPFFVIMFKILTVLFLPLPALAQNSAGIPLSISGITSGLLLLAVVIGTLYNLWKTTKAYGGLVGQGLNRLGLGILFFALEALDRISKTFGTSGIIQSIVSERFESMVYDGLLLLGLFFITLGFVKLTSALNVSSK